MVVADTTPGHGSGANPLAAGEREARKMKRHLFARLALVQLLTGLLLLCAAPLLADDCNRDWRRAEDCMRSPGFAQGLGTAAGVIATVLVNGAAITTLVFAPKPQPGVELKEGEEPPPPKQLNVQVYVQDADARQRTVFYADAQDQLFISAWVEEITPEGTVPTGAAIRFQLASATSWLNLTPSQGSPPATTCVLHRLYPGAIPEDAFLDPPKVYISTSLDGNPATIPVDLTFRRFRAEVDGPLEPPDIPDTDDGE